MTEYTPLEQFQIACDWLQWHARVIGGVGSMASAKTALARTQDTWADLVYHESLKREREEICQSVITEEIE